MKKLIVIVAAFAMLGLTASSYAQTPQAIKYQAIARNSSGDILTNQNVSFRISILQGNEQGAVVYQETQPATTNQFGLANLSIGQGNVVSGIFDSIKWGNGNYFIKVEFDPTGGNNYSVIGTSQLVSVPYSLYSDHARVADNIPNFPIKAALQATNTATPFTAPETGMLVYNTDSAGNAPYNVVPGYYYNAGTSTVPNWISLTTSNSIHKGGVLPPITCNTNTTYGGLTLGAAGASCTSDPSGTNNTGFGEYALGSGTQPSSSDNTAVGFNALFTISTGGQNTAVGSTALYTNSSGGGNNANGFEALYTNNGNFNTATGYKAMLSNTTGTRNLADGNEALYSNITGSSNTATGSHALHSNLASWNTATGDSALWNNTNGIDNVASGYACALANTTGDSNTANGYQALASNTTGSKNTAIGFQADVSSSGLINATAIGYEAKVAASNNLVLGATGPQTPFVGIGTSAPIAGLEIADGGANSISNCHIKSAQITVPGIAVTTANGITGASIAVTSHSTDTKGIITTTGTQNGTANTVLTITFQNAYNIPPVVLITPANGGTVSSGAPTNAEACSYYVTSTTTTFSLYFVAPNGNGSTPSFNYFVIE